MMKKEIYSRLITDFGKGFLVQNLESIRKYLFFIHLLKNPNH